MMNQFFRWIAHRWFGPLAALSLVIFTATLLMWVRSHYRHDHVRAAGEWFLDSDSGSVWIGQWTNAAPDPLYLMLRKQQPWLYGPAAAMPALKLMSRGDHFFYVSIAAVFGALPFLWLMDKAIRRQTRLDSGRWCLKCGYDLIATPDRCPECGTIPTQGR